MLSKKQEQAVKTLYGPILVVAGPGAGKTHTLTERLCYMTKELGISADSILVFTFTNAAAEEMKQRYRMKTDRNIQRDVRIGTFHSFFYSVLKSIPCYKPHRVIPGNVARGFVFDFFYRYLMSSFEQASGSYAQVIHKRVKMRADDLSDLFLNSFAKIQNESRTLQDLSDQEVSALFKCQRDKVQELIVQYGKFKKASGFLDFEDMQTLFLSLIEDDLCLLKSLRDTYRFILVDEFQDINPIQYKIVQLLAYPNNNLFVVGDEDQSIYGFRGSSPRFFSDFYKDYPLALKIILADNYRSTDSLVQKCKAFIQNNSNRSIKDYRSINIKSGTEEIRIFKNEKKESQYLSDILKYHHQHLPFSKMAVLLRTNQQLQRYSKTLKENKIPYVYNGRKYLPASGLFHVLKALLSIKEGIRKDENILFILQSLKLPEYLTETPNADYENATYKDLCYLVSKIQTYSLRKILTKFFWRFYFPANRSLSNVTEFKNIIKNCGSSENLNDFKRRYYQRLIVSCKDYVNIYTMHQAKGLEFDLVYIPGISNDFMPHPWASDREEERRILYVGMTRAKQFLYLSGNGTSAFNNELKMAINALRKG